MKAFLVMMFGLVTAVSPSTVQKSQLRVDEIVLEARVARKYDRIPDDPVNAHRVSSNVGLSAYSGGPYMITSVVHEDGKIKTIFRPTNTQGVDQSRVPKALLEIEQAVFDAAIRIRWAKKK